jgi:molecular chaperone DnaK
VTKAVFAVPVGHGSLQRSALELAAREAGLEVTNLLTEPSASVLCHGFHKKPGSVAVFDFGGGTFDFCVLNIKETAFQVLCAGGDSWLGGDDFDIAMANHLAEHFYKQTQVDLRQRAVEWQALIFACEQAKRELSTRDNAEIRLDDLLFTSEGRKGLLYQMKRKELEDLTAALVNKSITICSRVLAQAGLKPRQVDAVVMSGGTSLIPAVQRATTDFFGKRPLFSEPHLAVAKGTALRAAELSGEPIDQTLLSGRTIREVAGRTIGAGLKGGEAVTLIERSTPLPAHGACTFHTQRDNQTEMTVVIYEEAKSRIDESRSIGQLRYKGIKAAPKGQRKIDFAFLLDEDGLLHVTANVEGKEYNKTIRLG